VHPSADGTTRPPAPRIALAGVETAWQDDADAPLLLGALADHGAHAETVDWDDLSVDWGLFDLVVIRSTWNYTDHLADFLAWTERVDAGTTLANDAGVVHWNTDKRYLADLADAGVPIVPTTFVEPGASDPGSAIEAMGDGRSLVVKPTVSAGARDTARYEPDRYADAAAHVKRLCDAGRGVMVQPYLGSVEHSGETGMVFFGGGFSHAFAKGPLLTAGSAAVSGLFAPEQISPRGTAPEEIELADQVLSVAGRLLGGSDLLYARVDVLVDDQGQPVLLELELTEPSFFLHTDPGAARRAAEAFVRRAESAQRTRH
jgi:glutathione synthase/RimK-type ligase-like ATP-grasp enzyme